MVYSSRPVPLSISHQRERFSSVYSLLEQAVAARVFPGCSFAVLAPGASGLEVVALDAVGRQTYAEDSPNVVPETVYDLASLTKVLATTAMAMLLHERGTLHLDQPLVDILPGFAPASAARADSDRARVTLRHLLAHASGLAGYARLFETAHTPKEILQKCLSMPLEHPPGEHAEYSDIGFILLGKALETITGEAIDIFCEREVFAPCGMRSVGFLPAPSVRASIPPTEDDTTFRHRMIQGEVQDENCSVMGGVSGHAGLFGDALDVLRFAAVVIDSTHTKLNEMNLFSAKSIRLFSTRAEMPPGSSRALGWDTPSASSYADISSSGTRFSVNSIGHLGYAGTSLWIDFDARVAIVLLSNRTWPSRQSQAIRQLRPAFHDAVRVTLLGKIT